MERITGSEALGLFEAYNAVYAPNVVDIAAEIWVSACIEECIDFSQYTLDEITEGFIVDMSSEDLSESLLSEILGMPDAQNFGANLRQGFGKARRAVGGAIEKVGGGVKDVVGAGAQGLAGQKTTSSNPIAKASNLLSRGLTIAPRAAVSFGAGVLTGKGSTPKPNIGSTASTSANYTNAASGAVNAVRKVAERGNANASVNTKPPVPAVNTKPRVPSVNTKPPVPAAALKVTPAPNPSLAAASSALSGTGALAAKPKPQSDISAMITRSQQRQVAQTPKPAAAPAPARPMGGGRERMLRQSFDVFDVIKGHLLDEGYADTEEAAEAIMVNMSEDWKNSIIG